MPLQLARVSASVRASTEQLFATLSETCLNIVFAPRVPVRHPIVPSFPWTHSPSELEGWGRLAAIIRSCSARLHDASTSKSRTRCILLMCINPDYFASLHVPSAACEQTKRTFVFCKIAFTSSQLRGFPIVQS